MSKTPPLSIQDNEINLSLDESNHGQTPVKRRQRLARRLAARFLSKTLKIDQESRHHMAEILARLFHDIEHDVRLHLAQYLARRNDVPRNLLLALAHDEIVIAHDVIVYSPLLEDDDLIEIARLRSLSHRLAITLRRQISTAVSSVLIETDEEPVIRHLLMNKGCYLDKTEWTRIVYLARSARSLHEPVLAREDLEADIAKKLLGWISETLTQKLLKRFPEISDDHLKEGLPATHRLDASYDDTASTQDNPSQSLHKDRNSIRPQKASQRLAQRLKAQEAIKSRLLAETLRRGDVMLFEALLAARLDISDHLTRKLIHDHINIIPLILQLIRAKRSEAAMILSLLNPNGSLETLNYRLHIFDHTDQIDKEILSQHINLLLTRINQGWSDSKNMSINELLGDIKQI